MNCVGNRGIIITYIALPAYFAHLAVHERHLSIALRPSCSQTFNLVAVLVPFLVCSCNKLTLTFDALPHSSVFF